MKRLSPKWHAATNPANQRWQALRKERYHHQGGRCWVCKLPMDIRSFHAHHTHYRNLGRETLDDIRAVHPLCHKLADKQRRLKSKVTRLVRRKAKR